MLLASLRTPVPSTGRTPRWELARAALVRAVTFVELEQEGLVTDSEVDYATDQVAASLSELSELMERDEGSVSVPYPSHYVAELQAAVAQQPRQPNLNRPTRPNGAPPPLM